MKLKENIDLNYVEDPLSTLKEKLEAKNLHFSLKTVTEARVLKTINGLKKTLKILNQSVWLKRQ